jgi:hypothetical protein
MKICSGTLVDYYRRNGLSETPIEIQVLDDSTDDSVVETEALIHKIAQVGLDKNTLDVAIELVIKQEH